MSAEEIAAFSAVAGVLVTTAAVVVSVKSLRDQLWLQTFAEYTRRYADIVSDLPSEARRPGGDFDVAALEPPEQGRIRNAVRAYLNLCAEEYWLQRKGRIDSATWEIWRRGMEETFRLPWIRTSWSDLSAEYAYFGEFCEFVDARVRTTSAGETAHSAG